MLHWECLRWSFLTGIDDVDGDWGAAFYNEGAEQHSKALCVLSRALHGCVPVLCDCVLQVKYYLFPLWQLVCVQLVCAVYSKRVR